MEYVRDCPKCGKQLSTKNKYYYQKALNENKLCGSCALTGRKFSEEHKLNLSKNHADFTGDKNPFKGKSHTDKTRQHLSRVQSERMRNPSNVKILSDAMIEYHKTNDNSFKGKSHSIETKNKLKVSAVSRWSDPRNRASMSQTLTDYYSDKDVPFKGKSHTASSIKKMRLSAIDRISNAEFQGGQVMPNYNPSSIPFLEAKARELGITDLQHAENGGEFYIKELGYWVDGYSAEKNIVIEYDEPHHKYQVEKDERRQREIEEHLNCKFIRITEK